MRMPFITLTTLLIVGRADAATIECQGTDRNQQVNQSMQVEPLGSEVLRLFGAETEFLISVDRGTIGSLKIRHLPSGVSVRSDSSLGRVSNVQRPNWSEISVTMPNGLVTLECLIVGE